MTLMTLRRPWDVFLDAIDREIVEPLYREEWDTETSSGFIPLIDVFHDEERVTVRIEVPGCKREDLDVHVEGDVLMISGKKEHVPSQNYHQVESRCGSFRRSISLGHMVDIEKLSATYKDGVLMVTMPLLKEAKPKRIEIQTT